MATVAEIQAQIDALNAKLKSTPDSSIGNMVARNNLQIQIGKLQPQLAAAQKAESAQQSTPISQIAQPAPQQAAQPAQATPVAQVAPASSGNQLPVLKQSIIDEQFKNKRTNELTANNSDIRDQIYNAGWNQKSDAVRVLNGAGVYGIVSGPEGMGGTGYKSLSGKVATDQDFIDAAKAAGIDPSTYYSKQPMGMGGSQNVLNKTKLYNDLQAKGKDLYSVTNALTGAERGDAAPHATVLYKADGSGNLVAQNNPETGQPDVKYFSATRYANDPGIMGDLAPFLALAPAFGGILQAAGVVPTFGSATGTAAGSAGGGFGGGMYGSIGPAGFTALAPAAAGLPLNQVGALTSASTPAEVAAMKTTGDIVGGGAGAMGAGALANAGGTATSNIANALGNSALTNAIGAGGQALGSYLSGQAQADAAKEAAANQMAMFNTINQQFAPQRGAGYQSLNQIRSMLPGQSMTYNELGQPSGIQTGTDYLTRQFTPQDLYAGLAPNYNFMLGQGQQAQQRAANVGGGLIGGNALRGLQDYTQNYAQNAYQNAFGNFQNQRTGIYNTLAGIAGLGQQAQNTTAQAGQAATTAQGQLGVGAAAAQAAGLTGAANAAAGGLQNYQQNQILQAILGQNQNVAQTATPPYAP
jgi:hypothetical protein